jgi:hypothetical protein
MSDTRMTPTQELAKKVLNPWYILMNYRRQIDNAIELLSDEMIDFAEAYVDQCVTTDGEQVVVKSTPKEFHREFYQYKNDIT